MLERLAVQKKKDLSVIEESLQQEAAKELLPLLCSPLEDSIPLEGPLSPFIDNLCEFPIYNVSYLIDGDSLQTNKSIKLIRIDEQMLFGLPIMPDVQQSKPPRREFSFFKQTQLLLLPPLMIAAIPLLYYIVTHCQSH